MWGIAKWVSKSVSLSPLHGAQIYITPHCLNSLVGRIQSALKWELILLASVLLNHTANIRFGVQLSLTRKVGLSIFSNLASSHAICSAVDSLLRNSRSCSSMESLDYTFTLIVLTQQNLERLCLIHRRTDTRWCVQVGQTCSSIRWGWRRILVM